VGLLNVVAQASAAAHGIARAYLAPGEQVTTLADWWLRHAHHPGARPPQIALLEDWRRELLGADLLAILDGKLAVTFAPGIRTAARGEPAIRLLKVNE
jgi:ribonuclease D